MRKIIKTSLLVSLLVCTSSAQETKGHLDRATSVRKTVDTFGKVDQKDILSVSNLKKMFTEGKVTGQVRSVYGSYNQKAVGEVDSFTTALGGMLKYELASLNGFNAGFAFTTSQDLRFATGNKEQGKQNSELSSPNGEYTLLSEAYINYTNKGFNFRAGRQMMDTPLADSDDIRMMQNTFEAFIATYTLNDFTFHVGNIQRWQGYDAGLGYDANGTPLKSKWLDVGNGGAFFTGAEYNNVIKANIWYFDIPTQGDATKATFVELGRHAYTGIVSVHGSLQYLHEIEVDNSGVRADIYGVLTELHVYDIGFNLAYNSSKKHNGKRSFSGMGGGSLYTSMDTLILDDITEDRDARAGVMSLDYALEHWRFLYAYGDFKGKANSAGIKEHIVEQDIGLEYSVNDEFVVAAIYVQHEDKENTIKTVNDWDRLQIMAKYDF